MATVELFFDYLSPYAYFGVLEAPAVCRRQGADLVFRPILFAALLDHWGHRGPAEIPPKAVHMLRDCARHAARAGIRFRSPKYHPFVPLTALRVSLASVAGDDQPKVIETLFRAGWGDGIDLGDPAELAAALDRAGLNGTHLVSRASDPAVKAQLRSETERAIRFGVFGIPTMIVGEELFWGKDRLSDLEAFLAGEDPIAGVDLAALAPKGPAATRPGSIRRKG